MIIDALATVTYAGTKKNLVESGMVADTPAVAAPAAEGVHCPSSSQTVSCLISLLLS